MSEFEIIKHDGDTPQMAKLRGACRGMLARGIKPTATELEKVDPSFVTRRGTNITLSHGRLGKVRAEEFERAGWRLNTTSNSPKGGWMGRWDPPSVPTTCPFCGDPTGGNRPHNCN